MAVSATMTILLASRLPSQARGPLPACTVGLTGSGVTGPVLARHRVAAAAAARTSSAAVAAATLPMAKASVPNVCTNAQPVTGRQAHVFVMVSSGATHPSPETNRYAQAPAVLTLAPASTGWHSI